MITVKTVLPEPQKTKVLQFNSFTLEDQAFIQTYIDRFQPFSCEYNFSNLYAWQDACRLSWTLYRDRILIYDEIAQCAFMPLGEEFYPEELVLLSLDMRNAGLAPDFSLITSDYLKQFPEVKNFYIIKDNPDQTEYIYKVDKLCKLTGKKLHKKRNLISQFKRSYPDFKVHPLKGVYRHKAMELVHDQFSRQKIPSFTLEQEFSALEVSFKCFGQLGLEGLVVTVGQRIVAFSIFSKMNHSTYDIQFEKVDMDFKGAAQLINHETAKYLKDKCKYLNREQDLGIKGLRQAKMSYEPESLIATYNLVFAPPN